MHQLQRLDTCDLGGEWQTRWFDGQRGGQQHLRNDADFNPHRWMPARVPGEIHLDLMRAGLIDDVYTGMGSLSARWVEECQWTFRREFDAPAAAVSGHVWLVFERLELVARILLNGEEIAVHANAFTPCRVDVAGKLRPGRNVLAVHLESGLFAVGDKPVEGYGGSPDLRLHKRHWLRAPQCQFGWDWAPRLINVGITAPVRLEWTAAAMRLDRIVPLATVSDDLSEGRVRVRAFIEGFADQPVTATLRAALPQADVVGEVAITVERGLRAYEVELVVARPRLWWPIGHGEAVLYDLQVGVTGEGVAEQSAARIGFRRARFDQSPHPQGGRWCVLEINNRRIFAKGGNFVPADLIRAAIDAERYRVLVDRAVEANFNLLRVWGGGLYEDDEFYRQCDERGILVWQEFIFACGKYPGMDETFWKSVQTEAEHQVRRLASHPSLVVWCGNNENEWGMWDWGWKREPMLPDHAIYHHLLPQVLAAEDPTRHYQPSSPWSPEGMHPNRDDVGDQHPWGRIFNEPDLRSFRTLTCRFPNEGGFLGPTALPTVLECLPDNQRAFGSLAWRTHDNSIAECSENGAIDGGVRKEIALDPYAVPIEEWVHRAGLVQAEALAAYCDNFRRRMFDSAAAVFWMYNDCWPATRSWTIIDHRLRRTPPFHAVRRALAMVSVVVVEDGDQIVVFGVNDGVAPVDGDLRYGVFALAGGWPIDRRCTVTLASNASTRLATFARSEWADPHSGLAAAVLTRDGELVARNRLVLPLLRELAWPVAKPRVELAHGVATFTSDVFVWGVCLDPQGERALADDWFDLYPGVPHRVAWPWPEAPRIWRVGNLSGDATGKRRMHA